MATKTIVTFKNTENDLMNVRGAEPKTDSDFTTKNYVDGQVHGMLVITLVEDANSGTYTADRTYEQIKAAYDNKQNLAVRINEISKAQLPLLNAEFNNEDAGFTFGYTEMKAGEQFVVTRAIHYAHTANPVSDTWEDDDKTGYFLALNNDESSPEYGAVTTNINMASNSIINIQKLHINGEAPLYIGKVIETADPNKPRLTGVAGTNEAAFVQSDKQAEYVPVFVDTPTKANHATTKNYVDTKLATKLDADTSTGNFITAYVKMTNGTQNRIGVLTSAEANSIARRTSTGTLRVATPTDNNDAVNKSYVDGIFSYDAESKTLSITIV